MIDEVLSLLTERLNSSLAARFAAPDSMAVLSPLLSAGAAPIPANNKLAVTLINIEQERFLPNADQMPRRPDGRALGTRVPLALNLDVLISANFAADNYQRGLAVLSAAIGFMDSYPILTEQNEPSMPAWLSRLSLKMVDLDTSARRDVWTALGARYRPSALYRVRGVEILTEGVDAVPMSLGSTSRADARVR